MRCTGANLKHVILCTQRVARTMVESGLGGSIINVTSIEGVRAAPGYAAYAAAKAGVINFTKTAALELAPHGIRVNALAPDITLTEGMASVAPPGAEERFGLTVPMGRPGHVDEMAGAAVFLAGSAVQLRDRTDHPRRRRDPGLERLVPPSRHRRLRAGPVLTRLPLRATRRLTRPDPRSRRGRTCRRRWGSSAR